MNDPIHRQSNITLGGRKTIPLSLGRFCVRIGLIQLFRSLPLLYLLIYQSDYKIQNFVTNLNLHLLPRIQERLQQLSVHEPSHPESNFPESPSHIQQQALNSILIKDNKLFLHKVVRFYYTTYDIRRSEDIVNPLTSHCDIMLLATPENEGIGALPPSHPFTYARVLGIYHVNVIYTGPGMVDYEAMRFDFLFVRWFELRDDSQVKDEEALDRLYFPPMSSKGSFGFVDPQLVLRGCHLIPVFSQGRRHDDGIGLSRLSRDGFEWKSYFVNR